MCPAVPHISEGGSCQDEPPLPRTRTRNQLLQSALDGLLAQLLAQARPHRLGVGVHFDQLLRDELFARLIAMLDLEVLTDPAHAVTRRLNRRGGWLFDRGGRSRQRPYTVGIGG